MRARFCWLFALTLLLFAGTSSAAEQSPLLATWPTMSQTHIVFLYGGYLWSVPREGGEARQLTTGGHETNPVFSPDGKWIAFTGQYDGNADVFVIPSDGGEPKRLTWHPAPDVVVGWTPDGKKILFRSPRDAYADFDRIYDVPVEGGVPEFCPCGAPKLVRILRMQSHFAYVPMLKWQEAWKRYRGGQTTPIYVISLKDLKFDRIPRDNSNDYNPIWIGDIVYFISDRNGANTIFSYDTKSKAVKQLFENKGLDVKSIAAGPDAIVYEKFGGIYVYDLKSGKPSQVNIRIAGDLPATRAHWEKANDKIQGAAISPTGARAVFEARGEIFSVPAEKGDIRNLTRTTTVAERDPAWSPDGKWIAYFSDESGEYALHLKDQSGLGEVKKINLGNPPSFFYSPTWSPDSKKIAFTDKRLNLWYVDIEKGSPGKSHYRSLSTRGACNSIRNGRPTASGSPTPNFSPITCVLSTFIRWNLPSPPQLTDGLSDARFSLFDKSGKYLFFSASTDLGLSLTWLDLSGFQRPVSRSIYAVVLKKTDPNPVEPQSDDEKVGDKKSDDKGKDADKDKDKDKDKKKDADKAKDGDKKDGDKDKKDGDKKEEPPVVTIDLDGIGQRIVSLPIKPANYVELDAGKAGILFLTEIPSIPSLDGPTFGTVSKFDLSTRKTEPFLGGVSAFSVSANGEKALYRMGPPPAAPWFINPTAAAPKPGEGQLKLDSMEVYVDPRAEWNQMYHEVWRIERDFFYARISTASILPKPKRNTRHT